MTKVRFGDMTNAEVVGLYVKAKGQDIETGREIMRRVLDLAGLPPDEFATKPLLDRNQQPIVGNNKRPVVVEDYLSQVAVKHPEAIRGVLRFATTDPSSTDFEVQKQAIVDTVDMYT